MVDDQVLVRAGIVSLLEGMPGLVALEAMADGNSALAACARQTPDIVLLDLHLAQEDGWEVAAALRERHPGVAVVILTAHVDSALARRALSMGCLGFVSKDFIAEELALALRTVAGGRTYLSPSVAMQALHREPKARSGLSPRQRDVLRAIAQGQPNKQIARDLGLSVKTVEYHRAELIQRLDLHDVASLTRYAIAHGLID